jgi:hypothetical protein
VVISKNRTTTAPTKLLNHSLTIIPERINIF